MHWMLDRPSSSCLRRFDESAGTLRNGCEQSSFNVLLGFAWSCSQLQLVSGITFYAALSTQGSGMPYRASLGGNPDQAYFRGNAPEFEAFSAGTRKLGLH